MSEDDPVTYGGMQNLRKFRIFDALLDQEDISFESNKNIDIHFIASMRIAELKVELKNEMLEADQTIDDELSQISGELDDVEPDKIEEIKNIAEEAEKTSRISGKVIEYFALVSALIERMSTLILVEELADDQYVESTSTERMFQEDMSQELREDLLLRTGVIDDGLKGELSRVRKTRNNLFHEINHSILLNGFENIESELDRTIKTYNKLMEEYTGEEMVELNVEMTNE